jgi:hypothetical protein
MAVSLWHLTRPLTYSRRKKNASVCVGSVHGLWFGVQSHLWRRRVPGAVIVDSNLRYLLILYGSHFRFEATPTSPHTS